MGVYNLIAKILGIDDTELPNGQIKYLKDVASNKEVFKINTKNLFLFIEDVVKKHQLENIVLFKKGVSVFASDPNITQAIEIHDLYRKAKLTDNFGPFFALLVFFLFYATAVDYRLRYPGLIIAFILSQYNFTKSPLKTSR